MTLSWTRLATAVGGLALSVTAGSGVASAAPDLGPMVSTTCNYSQVIAALNAQDPATAAAVNGSPAVQSWLHSFLAAPPDQRQQMADQLQSMPAAQQYLGTVAQVANTCNNF
ncbi:MAG: hemophore-related protein [Mycobacterium sp.]